MTGPREEDGDYAKEFFDAYEREADRIIGKRPFTYPIAHTEPDVGIGSTIARALRESA